MSLICLVHGSTQGPEGWDLLVPELEQLGHRIVRPDLPTNQPAVSGDFYAEIIANAIPPGVDDAIVVAHSASGLFLPLVANRRLVGRIVFLTAAIPQVGCSLLDQLKADKSLVNPDWIGIDPTKDEKSASYFLFHDCPPETLPWALCTLRLMNPRQALIEPCPLVSWPDVASSYILCTEDRIFQPEPFRRLALDKLRTVPIDLPTGHCPQVAQPVRLAKELSKLAQI